MSQMMGAFSGNAPTGQQQPEGGQNAGSALENMMRVGEQVCYFRVV